MDTQRLVKGTLDRPKSGTGQDSRLKLELWMLPQRKTQDFGGIAAKNEQSVERSLAVNETARDNLEGELNDVLYLQPEMAVSNNII